MGILDLLDLWTPFAAYGASTDPSHWHDLMGASTQLYILAGASAEQYETAGPSAQLYILEGCR